jgi:septation ring formation regulator EzrA
MAFPDFGAYRRITKLLSRLEHAAARHDGKFAEAKQQSSHIDQRFSHLEKRLNDIQADVRDMTNKLKSVIKLEISKQAGILEVQAGRRVQGPPGP